MSTESKDSCRPDTLVAYETCDLCCTEELHPAFLIGCGTCHRQACLQCWMHSSRLSMKTIGCIYPVDQSKTPDVSGRYCPGVIDFATVYTAMEYGPDDLRESCFKIFQAASMEDFKQDKEHALEVQLLLAQYSKRAAKWVAGFLFQKHLDAYRPSEVRALDTILKNDTFKAATFKGRGGWGTLSVFTQRDESFCAMMNAVIGLRCPPLRDALRNRHPLRSPAVEAVWNRWSDEEIASWNTFKPAVLDELWDGYHKDNKYLPFDFLSHVQSVHDSFDGKTIPTNWKNAVLYELLVMTWHFVTPAVEVPDWRISGAWSNNASLWLGFVCQQWLAGQDTAIRGQLYQEEQMARLQHCVFRMKRDRREITIQELLRHIRGLSDHAFDSKTPEEVEDLLLLGEGNHRPNQTILSLSDTPEQRMERCRIALDMARSLINHRLLFRDCPNGACSGVVKVFHGPMHIVGHDDLPSESTNQEDSIFYDLEEAAKTPGFRRDVKIRLTMATLLETKFLKLKEVFLYAGKPIGPEGLTVNASFYIECMLCKARLCPDCLTVTNTQEHACEEGALASVAILQRDTKPCPDCGRPIHKEEGCTQMYCTVCRCVFLWDTMERETSTFIHNPHALDARRAERRRQANLRNQHAIQQQRHAQRRNVDIPLVEQVTCALLRQENKAQFAVSDWLSEEHVAAFPWMQRLEDQLKYFLTSAPSSGNHQVAIAHDMDRIMDRLILWSDEAKANRRRVQDMYHALQRRRRSQSGRDSKLWQKWYKDHRMREYTRIAFSMLSAFQQVTEDITVSLLQETWINGVEWQARYGFDDGIRREVLPPLNVRNLKLYLSTMTYDNFRERVVPTWERFRDQWDMMFRYYQARLLELSKHWDIDESHKVTLHGEGFYKVTLTVKAHDAIGHVTGMPLTSILHNSHRLRDLFFRMHDFMTFLKYFWRDFEESKIIEKVALMGDALHSAIKPKEHRDTGLIYFPAHVSFTADKYEDQPCAFLQRIVCDLRDVLLEDYRESLDCMYSVEHQVMSDIDGMMGSDWRDLAPFQQLRVVQYMSNVAYEAIMKRWLDVIRPVCTTSPGFPLLGNWSTCNRDTKHHRSHCLIGLNRNLGDLSFRFYNYRQRDHATTLTGSTPVIRSYMEELCNEYNGPQENLHGHLIDEHCPPIECDLMTKILDVDRSYDRPEVNHDWWTSYDQANKRQRVG